MLIRDFWIIDTAVQVRMIELYCELVYSNPILDAIKDYHIKTFDDLTRADG